MSAAESRRPKGSPDGQESGKLPGKTEFSGRRRSATRTSGHHSHPDATGGVLRRDEVAALPASAGERIEIVFSAPAYPAGGFVGYGAWFTADVDVAVAIGGRSAPRRNTLVITKAPNWGKFGSMWRSDATPLNVVVTIEAAARGHIAFWGLGCGRIEHEHLASARPNLDNMFKFSPEAHFYSERGSVVVRRPDRARVAESEHVLLALKQCNRCARFLPINLDNERVQLSFTNHCVAEHKRPCRHTGFGKLRDVNSDETFQLQCGYQLECRFCKKFEVNEPHNPQRTSAQMKEDGARRRSVELLLTELYGGSSQLGYRHHHNDQELADTVWERFEKKCFACSTALPTPKAMHLDHTRPLALLWPLDASATALCGSCNSQKRDRPPAEFYTKHQLTVLAKKTGVPLQELRDPSPNADAVRKLRKRLDWFFDAFLTSPQLVKVRDGKTAAELLVKALQKTINKCAPNLRFDIEGEFARRRGDE